MTARTLRTRWLTCGRWTGTVAERRVEPEEPPWGDEEWEPRDGRDIALTIGGQDWLAAIAERLDGVRRPVTLRWMLTTPPPIAGLMSSARLEPPHRPLTGRYGFLGIDGGLIHRVAGYVAAPVTLTVEGRTEFTVEDQVLVTLAHPWHAYAAGTRLTVPPRVRDQLDVAGYAARSYAEDGSWTTL